MAPIKDLKCCLKGCGRKATHLCDNCKTVGYCCSTCQELDAKYHSGLCTRLSRSKSKTKSKSKSKSKSNPKKVKSKSKSIKRKTK